MVLTQILRPSCVKMPLEGKDKRSAITELVNVLYGSDLLLDKEAVLESVLTREQIRGTGIGFGVAIPHGKCRAVKGSVMAIGIAKNPIDFGSFDGEPVSIIALLISALDQTVQHIQALAGISRLMLNETFRNKLRKINAVEEARELLKKHLQNESDKEQILATQF